MVSLAKDILLIGMLQNNKWNVGILEHFVTKVLCAHIIYVQAFKHSSNIKTAYTGGHQIIGRTQISDVALFRALQTQICEICLQCRLLHEKLRPHRKKWSNYGQ